jgi:hypothetical protein
LQRCKQLLGKLFHFFGPIAKELDHSTKEGHSQAV